MTERDMDNLIDLFRTDGPPAGAATHGLYFILPKPNPAKFQFVLVPLVRTELSISELTDLFLRGFVSPGTPREKIQAWIFDRLRDDALYPKHFLHPCFQVVSYPANGQIVNHTKNYEDGLEDIEDIPSDEPIRLICRLEWFRRGYGRGPGAKLYFGGSDATRQEVFYGVDGTGGRFPLRPSRDRGESTRETCHPAPVETNRSDQEKTRSTPNVDRNDLHRTKSPGEPPVPPKASPLPGLVYDVVAKPVKTNLMSVSSQEDRHDAKTPGEPVVLPSVSPHPAPLDQITDLENRGEEKGLITELQQSGMEQLEHEKMLVTTENNLLLALYKYAYRQGENFTTAAFVHLLRHLLKSDPKPGAEFVKWLTRDWISLDQAEAAQVTIEVQIRRQGKQPDIHIYAPRGRNAIIEVKLWDSNLNDPLLDRNTTLVFLTMKPLTSLKPEPGTRQRLWSEVEKWLELAGGTVLDRTSKHLIGQFCGFLAGRDVSGPNDGGLTFLTPILRNRRFQFALIPLVRKDLSINGLIGLFQHGVPANELERHKAVFRKLFGDHGCVPLNSSDQIREWIINTLLIKGLDSGRDLYRTFEHVYYPENGKVEKLTEKNVKDIDVDVPIRIICRPEWFRRGFGTNTDCKDYFGGYANGQEDFYGVDGRGGRFPLRKGTELPGDL